MARLLAGQVLLSLLGIVVLIGLAQADVNLRGVHPSDAPQYSGKSFACKDGSKTGLSLDKINDDYCDCEDGSDEPGTSACPNGRFLCRNLGHLGVVLFSSHVNDGICDCCDGSDEFDGKVKCPNDCFALGEDSRNAKRLEIEAFKTGLVIRRDYEQKAREARAEKQKQLEELRAAHALKLKDKSDLQAQADKLEGEVSAAEALLARYKPNPAAEQAEDVDEDEGEEEEEDYEEEGTEQAEEEESPEGEQTETVELLERTDDVKDQLEQAEKVISESKASKREKEERGEAEEDGVLSKLQGFLGLASSSSSSPLSGELTVSDLKEVRKRRDKAQEELDDLDKDIRDREDYLSLDLGEDAFHGLRDQAIEFHTSQYTYKLKPFVEVKQQHTRLGSWGEWLDPEHTKMEYSGGERCWNGPDRKTIVVLSCSDTNKILSVHEPNKCEYEMQLTTPAACSPDLLARLEQELTTLENPNVEALPLSTDIFF